MPHPRDEGIQAAFNRALSKYVTAHPEVTQTIQRALDNAMNTRDLEAEQATTLVTIEGLMVMMDKEVQAQYTHRSRPAGLPATLCQTRRRVYGRHYPVRRANPADC